MALTLAQAKTLTPEQQERVLKLSKAGWKNAAAQAQSLAQSLYDMNANNITTQNNPIQAPAKPTQSKTTVKAPAKTTVVTPPVAAQSQNTVTPLKPISTVNNTVTPNTVNKAPYLVKAPVPKSPVKSTTTPNPLGRNGEATVINSFDNPTTTSIQETPVSSNAATPSVVKLGTSSNTTAPIFKSKTAFTPEIITYLKSKGLSQGQIVVASNVNLNQWASSAIETIKKFADANKAESGRSIPSPTGVVKPTTATTQNKVLSTKTVSDLKAKWFTPDEVNQITSYYNLNTPEATRAHIKAMYDKKKSTPLDPNIDWWAAPDSSGMAYQHGSNSAVWTAVDNALNTAGIGWQSRSNVEQKIETSNARNDALIDAANERNKPYDAAYDRMDAEWQANWKETRDIMNKMHNEEVSALRWFIQQYKDDADQATLRLKWDQNAREAMAANQMAMAWLSGYAMTSIISKIKTDPVVQWQFQKIRSDLIKSLEATEKSIATSNENFLNNKQTVDKGSDTFNQLMIQRRLDLHKDIDALKSGKISAVFDVLDKIQNPIIEDIVTNTKWIVGKKEDQDNYERADSNLRKGLLKNALFNISPNFDMAKLTIEDMNNAAAMGSLMDAIVFLASRANDKDFNEKLRLQNAASSWAGGWKTPGTAWDELNKKLDDVNNKLEDNKKETGKPDTNKKETTTDTTTDATVSSWEDKDPEVRTKIRKDIWIKAGGANTTYDQKYFDKDDVNKKYVLKQGIDPKTVTEWNPKITTPVPNNNSEVINDYAKAWAIAGAATGLATPVINAAMNAWAFIDEAAWNKAIWEVTAILDKKWYANWRKEIISLLTTLKNPQDVAKVLKGIEESKLWKIWLVNITKEAVSLMPPASKKSFWEIIKAWSVLLGNMWKKGAIWTVLWGTAWAALWAAASWGATLLAELAQPEWIANADETLDPSMAEQAIQKQWLPKFLSSFDIRADPKTGSILNWTPFTTEELSKKYEDFIMNGYKNGTIKTAQDLYNIQKETGKFNSWYLQNSNNQKIKDVLRKSWDFVTKPTLK